VVPRVGDHHLALTRGWGLDPRPSAAITVLLVALLRTGSVRYGLRTHAARGFVEAPAKDERMNAPMT
jgi:hypothetical protein